ncbi:MAG: sterol desaturase family protein [Hyphomicrobiales bacterium]|nr:sterol desaturase family protein [Hyphomicrobiales bacterium]
MNEQRINEFLGDHDDKALGTGWWSNVLSAFFGALAFGGVLCLYFPQQLTTPELRVHYPVETIRLLIQGLIWAALFFGTIGSILRRKKVLAFAGLVLATTAALLGGANVKITGELTDGPAIGLDYFLLDLFATALIYVPLERFWPRYAQQGTFRPQWTLDLIYFISTHIPVQVVSFFILLPATAATRYLAIPHIAHFIASLPILVQFALAMIVADFAEWAIHFALHKVPFLWRFHSIHHSSKALDWIAGSRSHVVDDVLVRGGILVPMMLAFSQDIILAYLIFVTVHATWTHCNFGPSVKWLEPFLVMPRYHHWHHSSEKEAIDKNFAIHFPWIDRLFGTYYYPNRWPEKYGLDAEEIPLGFLRQTIMPFFRPNRKTLEPQG